MTSIPRLLDALTEAAERIPGDGGVATMGEMINAANDILINPADVKLAHLEQMFGGLKDMNKKLYALRQVIKGQAQRVADLFDAVKTGGDDRTVAEYATERQRLDMMMSVLSSVKTETARGLGMAFRNMEEWERLGKDPAEIAVAATGRTLYQLKLEAKLGKNLDTPGKVAKFIRDMQKRSAGRMLLELFTNNLISGIPTHVTYLLGNTVGVANRIGPETLVAALVGRSYSMAGREGERVLAGESWASLKEYFRSLPKATQAAIEAIRSGQSTLLPGEEAHPLRPYEGDFAEDTVEGIRSGAIKPEDVLKIAQTIQNSDVRWHEAGASLFGLFRGARDSILTNAALLASGGEAGAPNFGAVYSPLGQIPNFAIRGAMVLPIGGAIRLPSRGVAALHSFQRTGVYSIEINARAYRQATAVEGLTGTLRDQRIAYLRQNPPAAWMEEAHAQASEAALMDKGRELVRLVSRLANYAPHLPGLGETPVFRFIDPFIKVAANITDQSLVQRTPLGFLSSELRADLTGKNGNTRQDMATARMITGTLYSIGIGSLAAEGYITGSGPSDPSKRAVWQQAGYQAHSVKIGDIWYDVHRLGPLGMLMGVSADMYDVAHKASEGEMLNAGATFMHAVVQNMLDESFMKGPADLIQAIENKDGYGQKYIRDQLSSLVIPYSVGMSYQARAIDPYTRHVRTIADAMKAKIPGQSESVFPNIDIWGQPVPNHDALVVRGLTAIYESRMSRDPVNIELSRLGIGIAKVPETINNVKLTPQEYDDFARLAGRMTKQRLDVIVTSPDWRTWTPEHQRQMVKETVTQCRETARGAIKGKYRHIAVDGVKHQQARFEDQEE